MDEIDITVPVPRDRVANFYRWFADWVDPVEDEQAGAPTVQEPVESVSAASLAAERWWSLLKQSERDLVGFWAAQAPRMISAATIVSELGLKGPRDIPGILAWPSRKGSKVGFKFGWSFRRDPITREPLYGIEDVEYAGLILKARDSVQGQ